MQENVSRKVLPFRPRTEDLEAFIRAAANDDRKVFFGPHARERMEARGISRLDALRVLKRGFIEGPISQGRLAGELKVKVVARIKGSREIGVVTILVNGGKLFIKTVEWEDI